MSQTPDRPELETAILGGGCFWCLEAVFDLVDGVEAVVSGYCGGHVDSPGYREVCTGTTGHAEVVKIVFDPARVSFRDLLEIFFTIHDPTTLDRQGNDVGPQYRSVIFATTDAQRETACALIDELGRQQAFAAPIVTRVEAAPAILARRSRAPRLLRQAQRAALLPVRGGAQGREIPRPLRRAAQALRPCR